MSRLYEVSSTLVERLRSLFQKRIGDGTLAYLGDKIGPGARTDVPGRPGYVYVRFPNGRDASGSPKYTAPTMARAAGVPFQNFPGAPVYVAVKYNNELEIVSAHYAALDKAGINTSTLNSLNQQSKWVYPYQLTYGLASAVATTLTESTLVMVKKFRHYVGNQLQAFETPLEADKIDLAAYIPGMDEHCYACVWIDTYLNEAVVVTSITQPLDEELDESDIQELVYSVSQSRPPDATSLKAFYLSNDQGTIRQTVADVDLRLWLYNPPAWGFPSTLRTLERVRPGYILVTGPYEEVDAGGLTIEAGGQVIIVHQNTFDAITDPDADNDSSEGYSVGSLWFNALTGVLWINTVDTASAAVWDMIVGGGAAGTDTAAVHVNVDGEIAAITPKTALVGADTFLGEDSEDGDAKFSTTLDDIAAYIEAGGSSGYILIQDQKASGVQGGGFTSGADQTRTLNTIVADTVGIGSLSSNRFTLPAGTYRIRVDCPGFNVGSHQAFLYNFTDSTVIARGTSAYCLNTSNSQTVSTIVTRFTLAGSKAIEVRHRAGVGRATDGFGVAAGMGTEVYTIVEIVKE